MGDIFDEITNWDFFGRRETRKETISGVNVEINLLFSKYPKTLFNTHIAIAEKWNLGVWRKEEDVPEKIKGLVKDLKTSEIFFNRNLSNIIMTGKRVPYDYKNFKKLSANIISTYIFYLLKKDYADLLKQNNNLIKKLNDARDRKNKESDFMIVIQIMDGYKEGSLAVYDGTNSRITGFNIELSGGFLVGRIYMPYLYTQKVDASYIEKTLVHEFEHRMQDMNGLILKEQTFMNYKAKSLGLDPESWKNFASNTYQALMGLLSEGAAVFIERKYSDKISFDLDEIERLKNLLLKMSKEKDAKNEAKIFDEEFSKNSRTGEYYLGFIMCYFIALSIYKRETEGKIFLQFDIKREGKVQKLSLHSKDNQIQEYMVKQKKFILLPLPPNIISLAQKEINNIRSYVEFIKKYEEACDYLGLKEPVKFFTTNLLNELNQNFKNKIKKQAILQ